MAFDVTLIDVPALRVSCLTLTGVTDPPVPGHSGHLVDRCDGDVTRDHYWPICSWAIERPRCSRTRDAVRLLVRREPAVKLFYIPDGHRRYAESTQCSLKEAYVQGYEVLVHEIIEPLFEREGIERLDVFLLSSLNLKRRATSELQTLIECGTPLLDQLVEHCKGMASVRTVGSYFCENVEWNTRPGRELTLIAGSTVDDDLECDVVDVFIRSGGEIRLSGAPRSIIGNDTQFYGIDELHPHLRFSHIQRCLDAYRTRYIRRTDTQDAWV